MADLYTRPPLAEFIDKRQLVRGRSAVPPLLDAAGLAAFRRDSRQVVRELELLRSRYGGAGPRTSECHALLEIAQSPGLGPGVLAARLRLDKTAVSRLLRGLRGQGWVHLEPDPEDGRQRRAALTAEGRRQVSRIDADANRRVRASLECLRPEEAATVVRGMALYAQALARARAREGYAVRLVSPGDDAALSRVIRAVRSETSGRGPGSFDDDVEVDAMSAAYRPPRAAYFVLTRWGRVVGGAGIGPLSGGDHRTCELRKMYFLPEARGKGFGQVLLDRCLEAARGAGYRRCYLETLRRLAEARGLYEKNGFRPRRRPLGNTGHRHCDAFYVRALSPRPNRRQASRA
jgi:putative acetyltransferase